MSTPAHAEVRHLLSIGTVAAEEYGSPEDIMTSHNVPRWKFVFHSLALRRPYPTPRSGFKLCLHDSWPGGTSEFNHALDSRHRTQSV